MLHIDIIFEDDHLLLINKPVNIVVNRAESTQSQVTVQDWIETKHRPKELEEKTDSDFFQRSGIVHRLDKETSGLLLIAKTLDSFTSLQSQFKKRVVSKKYLTLVHGKVIPRSGKITATVGRLPWNRERFGVLAGGRLSVTNYEVINYYSRDSKDYTYLCAIPETGRTHQIRIHLKYIGRSVVADKFYAGRKTYREDLSFCPRLFLHAYYLGFQHPVLDKKMNFEIDLAEDLQVVLDKMTLLKDN